MELTVKGGNPKYFTGRYLQRSGNGFDRIVRKISEYLLGFLQSRYDFSAFSLVFFQGFFQCCIAQIRYSFIAITHILAPYFTIEFIAGP
jgi:hypothetical protein